MKNNLKKKKTIYIYTRKPNSNTIQYALAEHLRELKHYTDYDLETWMRYWESIYLQVV